MSDDDTLLRLTLNEDVGVDVYAGVGLFEKLHSRLHHIGNLLVVVEKYFLSYYLCNEKACRLVGQLVLVEVRRAVGQQLHDSFQHHIHVELCQRRYRQNLSLGQQLVQLLHSLCQLHLIAEVYLVYEHQHRNIHLVHLFDELHVLFGCLNHVCDVQKHVGVAQSRTRETQHRLLQFVVGFQHSGGVRKYNLCLVGIENAHDAVTRRLCLKGGNGDALANEQIHQRRLTHVGVADNVYKTCFMHILHLFRVEDA